jgi:hypothetical protein
LISVRSEVQVFPGPPRFALRAWRGAAAHNSPLPSQRRSLLGEACERARRAPIGSSGYGAIAQLGERVLCKHEVVGSIPSGSTTFELRAWRGAATLAHQAKTEPKRVRPRSKSDDGRLDEVTQTHRPRETQSAKRGSHQRAACVFSDIVKRRSIRVGSCKRLRDPSLSVDHFGARSS